MYRILEQENKSIYRLMNERGGYKKDVYGNDIVVDENNHLIDSYFYIVENLDDEDDTEVFDDFDKALDYVKSKGGTLEY